ncbi:ABC transporter ATP-binding protein [Ciceribacter ferrooxidans]|uniref:ABC transporter ATP-binding protein n=1 Tax=Ciceribacter ferrooxidans TaxID=2509717 RepID=A0A4Q2SYV0_9HYPH|nr:ABC transporter ATP-binding protein [Ciceribacter ferrooxidans]RYC10671.1 ABC transporter ATP-binding protein [Ciceribacter ferrooxidans]
MARVELRNVWKKFGSVEVIKGVDLDIEDGEFIVLVGPSGCGKSTLLNLVAGLETLTSGDIRIGEDVVNDVPPKDRNIAMVFQSYALYPTKSVQENITFGMQTRRIAHDLQERALADVSQLLHIDQLLDRKPGQLSGGQRQRVAMGRALVRNPDVFLFDEPLSNLDAKLRIEMRTEVKKLHLRLGKTIIYVTHDQIEAMTLASRIAVMDNGHIRQFGTPEEIYENPIDLFVAGFMGSPSMNIVRGRVAGNGGTVIEVSDEEGTVQFPLSPKQAEKVADRLGSDIYLGMRPETIAHRGAHGADGGETFVFERKVDVVEPTGPDTMLVFTLGGTEAIARVRPEEKVKPGEFFSFEVNMAKAKLFDAENGNRL